MSFRRDAAIYCGSQGASDGLVLFGHQAVKQVALQKREVAILRDESQQQLSKRLSTPKQLSARSGGGGSQHDSRAHHSSMLSRVESGATAGVPYVFEADGADDSGRGLAMTPARASSGADRSGRGRSRRPEEGQHSQSHHDTMAEDRSNLGLVANRSSSLSEGVPPSPAVERRELEKLNELAASWRPAEKTGASLSADPDARLDRSVSER